MTQDVLAEHPVYPGGPPCGPRCPGEWSMYHDGYADGYMTAEAALADTAGIDVAWREAEAALPEGWRGPQLRVGYLTSVKRVRREYEASAWFWPKPHTPLRIARADTPAAALMALAAALRTPKPEGPKPKRVDWSNVVVDEGDEAP